MIIIVGVGRSGTSLLQSMLNTHSRIAFLPEIKFLRRFLFTKGLEQLYKSEGRDAVITRLSCDRLIGRLGLNISKLLEDFDFQSAHLDIRIFEYLSLFGQSSCYCLKPSRYS